MIEVYLLSVVLNSLAGIILSFFKEEAESGALSLSLNNKTVRLIIGGMSFLTGILKILSPVRNNIPVIGDLFPAAANLAGGFMLLFESYRQKGNDSPAFYFMERIAALMGHNRKLLGFACITAAALHFIFYQLPLL